MSYITQNGEHRTTVSVRLTDAELDALDAWRYAISRRRADAARREGLTNTARMWDQDPRRTKRSEVLRELIVNGDLP